MQKRGWLTRLIIKGSFVLINTFNAHINVLPVTVIPALVCFQQVNMEIYVVKGFVGPGNNCVHACTMICTVIPEQTSKAILVV